jgi:hypothetical protein
LWVTNISEGGQDFFFLILPQAQKSGQDFKNS